MSVSSFKDMKQMVDDHYPLYIGGQWVEGSSGETLEVYCPANGERVTTVAAASKADVDAAVKAAWAAWPAWRDTPMPKRYAILQEIYARITAKAFELGVADALDAGCTVSSAEWVIHSGASQFPYFASLINTMEDGVAGDGPGARTMVVREPVGVVGAITPWNGPFMLGCWKLAPALAAGNCVVLKPSSYTPTSNLELIKLIADLLPPGVLNIINGKGSTTGQYLLDHPGISKLSFTGSTEIGISAGIAAAKNIIPSTLELGGKSAGIYFADIPEEQLAGAVAGAAFHATANSGQICAAQTRVLVEAPLYDRFVEMLAGTLRNAKVGMPWDAEAAMGAIVYKEHMESILEYIELGKKEGASLVCGGNRITEGEMAKGYFVAPTVFADVDNSMRIAQEEIFGPVLSVIKFSGEQEAVQIANDSRYGLSGGVTSGDLAKAMRVATAVRTGTMFVNGAFGRSLGGACFGGYKASGIGRECYKTTYDQYCLLKTINFAY